MSEEQRARKFVERHFPVTAAFLAAEPAEGEPPVFGPAEVQNAHDDQPEPFVVVRVAYRLSRFELFAALADGYATTNTGADPDDMTVQQIRSDVEAYLCGASWRDMEDLVETVARQIEGGEHPEQMAALRRAMDRAYPLHREPEPASDPVYGNGTVTLTTTDQGRVTEPEPEWCIGHEGQIVSYRSDITHRGPWEAAWFMGVEFFPAGISWAPAMEPVPVGDFWEFPPMDPGQLRELGALLAEQVGRVYRLANFLDQIRRGMQ
ncbi:DUF6907 domain-containing protein [Streptomyces sp. N50]|uniref:DUF6907 domain-containing protein n=1 Tax=Streptomyces sp. N50 TaxID=3081765 RepID=UPI0029623F6A|nr:hypothetical protein [Streptomyces sp. N50]WOX09183.1 hypothetical protein R2B38_09915 [Streptomyces sp. N50]